MRKNYYNKGKRKMAKINSDVFFISPDGKIVPVHEGRHINAILKYPKVFGFTKPHRLNS